MSQRHTLKYTLEISRGNYTRLGELTYIGEGSSQPINKTSEGGEVHFSYLRRTHQIY